MNTQLKYNWSIAYFGFAAAFILVSILFSFASFSSTEALTKIALAGIQSKAQHQVMDAPNYTSIKEATWQYRVLIVDKTEAAELDSFQDILSKNAKAIEERRLLIVTIFGKSVIIYTGESFDKSGIQANELLDKLRGKKALLIGLDGGDKAVYDQIDLKTVFGQIDGMPMRRREIRGQ